MQSKEIILITLIIFGALLLLKSFHQVVKGEFGFALLAFLIGGIFFAVGVGVLVG